MMRLILYSWNANNEQILADNLTKAGFEVIWFRKECKHYTRDMELAMDMIPFIHAQKIDVVVSFNYFPIISMICDTCQIPYYAWVFDCPHFTLYAKQITLPCNHIGIFDREIRRNLHSYGVETVYHVPLAVDTGYFDNVITDASSQERMRYQCDISFVGSLYTGEFDYYDRLFHREQEEKSTYSAYEHCIERQCFAYKENYLRQAVTNGDIDMKLLQRQMEKDGLMLGDDYFAKSEDVLMAAVLEKKVTVEERRTLLTETVRYFAHYTGETDHEKQTYDFRLYTASNTSTLPDLNPYNQGPVDYHTQMPLVFAGSKINLNTTLRSIHSGIPLRVLDIMACGGFVLSNWQPEIADYFSEGIEIVTYDNLEDCLDKIAYYLTHDEERKRIAANGRKKIQKMFTYQVGLGRLFK